MQLEWRQTGQALFANAVGREYIICRRMVMKGVRYVAWCDMRGGWLAEKGPIGYEDIPARKAAIELLKEECGVDADNWGFGKWNC